MYKRQALPICPDIPVLFHFQGVHSGNLLPVYLYADQSILLLLPEAVSYTHLDVYKRQAEDIAEMLETDIETVREFLRK